MGVSPTNSLFLIASGDQEVANNHRSSGDSDANLQADSIFEFETRNCFNQAEGRANGLFGIILMRFGIAKIRKHAVAHIARYNTFVIANDPCDFGMVTRLMTVRKSSGSSRTERAVDPTMSQNNTVS